MRYLIEILIENFGPFDSRLNQLLEGFCLKLEETSLSHKFKINLI